MTRFELCQRPKRASFISTYMGHLIKKRVECVNALNGLLSFLLDFSDLSKFEEFMCQRPKRASFISTVPSGNPHKH